MSDSGEFVRREFDINAEARAHGDYLGLPQKEGETDVAFRERIAGVLRGKGQIIEAHEVRTGRRYDDPEQDEMGTMVGIIGAITQEMIGHRYSPLDDERQVGDDLAVGIVATNPDRSLDAIRAAFDLLGPELGAQFLLGGDDHGRTRR